MGNSGRNNIGETESIIDSGLTAGNYRGIYNYRGNCR